MSYGFARNGNARALPMENAGARDEIARNAAPYIVIAGPEKFSQAEMDGIKAALEKNGARVAACRVTEQFRIAQFATMLAGCTWLLLGVDEFPGEELRMLQTAERELVPKIGIIALASRIHLTSETHIGGAVDLFIKRTPLDPSFSSLSRTNHVLLAEDLTSKSFARDIVRIILPGMR